MSPAPRRLLLLFAPLFFAACSAARALDVDAGRGDPFDVPINGVTKQQVAAFDEGDNLFDLELHEADGLGPLYTRESCGGCHDTGVRGPGFVQKMAVVLDGGVDPSPDQSELLYGATVHPLCAGGGTTPVLPPDAGNIRITVRVGPPILGRGYMEAVDDSEILAAETAQAQRTDGIHGRVNHVVYGSQTNPDSPVVAQYGDTLIGRFGLKARIASLDDFVADAFQGDMGITSPMRPTEIPNPDGLTDDEKPGVDVTMDSVNKRANYIRMTAIPRRDLLTAPGKALFSSAKCDVCHVPAMKTRADYPLALLAGIDAPVYTDFLLHNMGDALADGTLNIDGQAHSRDWRTAPLIGLRFNRTYLHDGRATSIEDAIFAHAGPGSEANESVTLFQALSASDQQALLTFVRAL